MENWCMKRGKRGVVGLIYEMRLKCDCGKVVIGWIFC